MSTSHTSTATDGAAPSSHALADLLPWNVRLAPAEPTREMIRAALDCQEADPEDGPECEVYYAYLAMLAAAPVPTIPATPAGYVLRNETGMTVAFNASEPAEGELPEGWTEVPVFTAQSSGLPLNVAPADERPEISASLVKTVAEGALGLNPTLSKEDAEELLGYLSKLTGSR